MCRMRITGLEPKSRRDLKMHESNTAIMLNYMQLMWPIFQWRVHHHHIIHPFLILFLFQIL